MRWLLIAVVVLGLAGAVLLLLFEDGAASATTKEEDFAALDPEAEPKPPEAPKPQAGSETKPKSAKKRPADRRNSRRPAAKPRSDVPATPPGGDQAEKKPPAQKTSPARPPKPPAGNPKPDKAKLAGFVREAGFDAGQLELTDQDWQDMSNLVGERPKQLDEIQTSYKRRIEEIFRERKEAGDIEPADEESQVPSGEEVIASRELALEDGTRGRIVIRRGSDYQLDSSAEEQTRLREEILDLIKSHLAGR